MLKRVSLISVAILFVLLTVVGVAVFHQRPVQELVVMDDANYELQFFELPTRVVVLEPAVARLMQQWQREKLVIATSAALSHLFPGAENLGSRGEIEVLQLAATRPELIIAGASDYTLAEDLREAGLPVLMVAPDRLQRLFTWPETLGAVLAADQQALQFTRLLEKQFSEFQGDALEQPGAGRRVVWIVDDQFTMAGGSTLEDDQLELIGVKNAAGTSAGYTTITPEEIALLAPDVIIAPQELLPSLDMYSEVEQPPLLVELGPQPGVISWDDVFIRAKRLLTEIRVVLPQQEE